MTSPPVGVDVSGGQIQGIVGAGSVVIENLTFYSRPSEEPVQPAGAEPIGPCPYPGLAYFGPSDADLFFGRDAAIARLAEAVGRQSFTALVGASGSGKSSVVLAGLAPRLHSAGNWRFSHFRVGTELEGNPFLALARALSPLYIASDSDVERLKNTKLLATSLANGELTLRDVFADCRSRNEGRRIVLIADQFEEVFTSVQDEVVGNRFIDVLLAGFPDRSAGGVPEICLILTMRADFYGRALRHRPLADALQGRVENLGPMNREELRAAIVRPAENAGVTFEPGVVETLLDSVQGKPGGLPLLQFALREMWSRQERKKITRKSYDEIGGVEGALAQRAETVFAGLTRNGADATMDKAFQRLFTRLVTLGEGQEDTRRVVERQELGDSAWFLAQRLAGEDNRLVVTNAPSALRETVEMAHEALIHHWPRLVDWINRDRAFQSWLRQIKPSVELRSINPIDDGPLLRGGMLAQAIDWLARRRDDLNPQELDFIEASIALHQRLEEEKEATRQREIRGQQELAEAADKLANEQRRRAKIAFVGGVIAVVLAVISAVIGGYAVLQNYRLADALRNEESARKDRIKADAERFYRMAERFAEGNLPWSAIRIAVTGLTALREPSDLPSYWRAIDALASSLPNRRVPKSSFASHKGNVYRTAFSADGKRVLTASEDGTVGIWNRNSGTFTTVQIGTKGRVIAFSPDGMSLILGSSDENTAWIFELDHPETPRVLLTDWINTAAFSPEGNEVAIGSGDGIRILNARNGQERLNLRDYELLPLTATFSRDGRLLATAATDGKTRIWDVQSGVQLKTLETKDMIVGSIAFSSDNSRLITAPLSIGQAFLWDVDSGKRLLTLDFKEASFRDINFTSDGKQAVAIASDGTIRFWETRTGSQLDVLRADAKGFSSLAISSADEVFVTGDASGKMWLWENGNPIQRLLVRGRQESFEEALLVSAESRLITITHDERARPIVRLWDTRTRELLRTLQEAGANRSATLKPDGTAYATVSERGEIFLWGIDNGDKLAQLRDANTEPGVFRVRFTQDGRRITAIGGDNAQLLDASTGAQLRIVSQVDETRKRGSSSGISDAEFSLDGTRAVIVNYGGAAELWDVVANQKIRSLHDDGTNVAVWSGSAGTLFATGSEAGVVRVWDAQDGEQLRAMRGHKERVNFLSFSPDGTLLATSSTDGTARLWAVSSGTELAVFRDADLKPLLRVAFVHDGSKMIIPHSRGAVSLWELPSWRSSEEMVAYAKSLPLAAPDREWCGENGVLSKQCRWPPL